MGVLIFEAIRNTFGHMSKRVISVVVLVSLVLHFSSRMGFLAYVYKQRHEVARFFGVIEEVPIAECRSSFYLSTDLLVDGEPDDDATPAVLSGAPEITLFFNSSDTDVRPEWVLLMANVRGVYIPTEYTCPETDVFQPPRI